MTDVNEKDQWMLSSVKIEFQSYGEHKGKYAGTVNFRNGSYESFQFNIYPEMAQRYIDLIAVDIVKGANLLGQRLIDSLGLSGKVEMVPVEMVPVEKVEESKSLFVEKPKTRRSWFGKKPKE